jgi:hypothetical protein
MSAFMDKSSAPAARALATALGAAAPRWEEIKREIASRFAPLSEEWVFSGKQYGWSLRLKQKKRAVLYLTPLEGYFRAAFALGEKAAAAASEAKLPAAIWEAIDKAPRYAEGRAVRIEVRNARDVRSVVKVAEIKMAN